jgi:hypothetical protein
LLVPSIVFPLMRRFVKSNDSPRYRQLIREMLAETPAELTAPTAATIVA